MGFCPSKGVSCNYFSIEMYSVFISVLCVAFYKLEAASQANEEIRVSTSALRTVFYIFDYVCISSCDADDVCSYVSLQLCLQTKSVYLWDVKFLLCGGCNFERPIMQ